VTLSSEEQIPVLALSEVYIYKMIVRISRNLGGLEEASHS